MQFSYVLQKKEEEEKKKLALDVWLNVAVNPQETSRSVFSLLHIWWQICYRSADSDSV